jgi:glycosyltransferase involved in cell wall biosynthesis
MKISILTPDFSHNCIARAYILAKALKGKYKLEIIGPKFGNGIWKPLTNDKEITFKSFKLNKNLSISDIRLLYRAIDGDLIFASKPLLTSFGIGLMKKFFSKKPLIVDIDDWELGFRKEYLIKLSVKERLRYLFIDSVFSFLNNSSYWNILFLQKIVRLADRISVSSSFLNDKFGGTLVYHGRDENQLDPEKFSRIKLRKKYKIRKNDKVIMFFGSPKPHKGLEDLIDAISLSKYKNLVLVIVGIDDRIYSKKLKGYIDKKGMNKIKIYGMQPFHKIPEFLSITDIIVIPQRKNYSSIGQVPSKLFDAMSMAKPIIATDVSDISEILAGSGLVVKPSDPKSISDSIDNILSNPKESAKMGKNARKRLIKEYSWDNMREILYNMIEEVRQNYAI